MILRRGNPCGWTLLVPGDKGFDARVAVNVTTGGEDGVILSPLVAEQTKVLKSVDLYLQGERR